MKVKKKKRGTLALSLSLKHNQLRKKVSNILKICYYSHKYTLLVSRGLDQDWG